MTEKMTTVDELINQETRKLIENHLRQCTTKQYKLFEKLWPNGIDGMPDKDLRSALALVLRTIFANDKSLSDKTPHVWNDVSTEAMLGHGERMEKCENCDGVKWCGILRPDNTFYCPFADNYIFRSK